MGRQVFPTALLLALALALPISWAHIGEEIPQAQELAVALPAPAPEDLLGRKSGGGGGGLSSAAYTVSEGPGPAPAPAPAPSGGGLGLGAGGGLGGGLGAGSSGGTTDVTTPASGGSEFDLVGTLFNGNAQAFTQAVLASGTSSAAIAVSGMLDLYEPAILKTLRESLAGPDPGATAVAKAVTGGWQMSVCQSPERAQDATAAAISGGDALAAAAARGLARAALQCCSKVAEHLAGALLSLEAGPSFVQDLDTALKATASTLPACAIPSQLSG